MKADKDEATALACLAIGRLLRICSRPYQPGDDEEYSRIRAIILDASEIVRGKQDAPYSFNYAAIASRVRRVTSQSPAFNGGKAAALLQAGQLLRQEVVHARLALLLSHGDTLVYTGVLRRFLALALELEEAAAVEASKAWSDARAEVADSEPLIEEQEEQRA